MKIGFLITARLKSSRLPLKLLLDLNGKTVFERVIERCKKVSNVDEIILCTSTKAQDRPLVDIALKNNIYYFLGSEEDVLQRLSDAATFFDLDFIVNITGENPLFSIYHANLLVDIAKQADYDFVTFKGLPVGCAVYGIRPEALRTVCEIKKEVDTEIWGPLLNRPEIFNTKEIEVDAFYTKPALRITTDYLEDYHFIRAIYNHFPTEGVPSFIEVLQILEQNPQLLKINEMRTQAGLPEVVIDNIVEFYNENRDYILEIKKKHYQR